VASDTGLLPHHEHPALNWNAQKQSPTLLSVTFE